MTSVIGYDGTWEVHPGPKYLGRRRDGQYAEWDQQHGAFNWILAWKINGTFVQFEQACRLYEDAYYEHMKSDTNMVDELVKVAANVYDDEKSNIVSGFNYTIQETERTHVQDIAIRNALLRLGRWFEGEELIQIRDKLGKHSLSMALSPGRVPFHRPDWITDQLPPNWWKPNSVEHFYQSNRRLLVRAAAN